MIDDEGIALSDPPLEISLFFKQNYVAFNQCEKDSIFFKNSLNFFARIMPDHARNNILNSQHIKADHFRKSENHTYFMQLCKKTMIYFEN